jgi:hypothetical protein
MTPASKAFFTIAWQPPIVPGLLPLHPSSDGHPYMRVAWQARHGFTFYLWQSERPKV